MVIKDWKRIKKDVWQNPKRKSYTLHIVKNPKKKEYVVIHGVGDPILGFLDWDLKKFFKTKAQALKFAKNYMRKN